MVVQPRFTRRSFLGGISPALAPFAAGVPVAALTPVRAPMPPVTGAWTPAGAMAQPRVEHRMTRLRDGRVLVTGGSDGTDALATAELYDPATNRWTPAAAMIEARSGHTATLLADGRVLVAGGFGARRPVSLTTAEVYDAVRDDWLPVAPMRDARSGHSAVAFADAEGREGVLVVGGGTAREQQTAERYEPARDAWSSVGSMAEYHLGSTLEVLPDGEIVCIGGSGNVVAEHYNRHTERWTTSGPLMGRLRRGQMRGALLRGDGRVILTGGIEYAFIPIPLTATVRYDHAVRAWVPLAPMVIARTAHSVTSLGDDRLLVAGGRGGADAMRNPAGATTVQDTAEVYDPRANAWTPAARMAEPRHDHEAVELPDGGVLVTGGYDARRAPLAAAERFR